MLKTNHLSMNQVRFVFVFHPQHQGNYKKLQYPEVIRTSIKILYQIHRLFVWCAATTLSQNREGFERSQTSLSLVRSLYFIAHGCRLLMSFLIEMFHIGHVGAIYSRLYDFFIIVGGRTVAYNCFYPLHLIFCE